MSAAELLKLAEELEAKVAGLEATREDFLDEMDSTLNQLRVAGGLPRRDLRAELKVKKAVEIKAQNAAAAKI